MLPHYFYLNCRNMLQLINVLFEILNLQHIFQSKSLNNNEWDANPRHFLWFKLFFAQQTKIIYHEIPFHHLMPSNLHVNTAGIYITTAIQYIKLQCDYVLEFIVRWYEGGFPNMLFSLFMFQIHSRVIIFTYRLRPHCGYEYCVLNLSGTAQKPPPRTVAPCIFFKKLVVMLPIWLKFDTISAAAIQEISLCCINIHYTFIILTRQSNK